MSRRCLDSLESRDIYGTSMAQLWDMRELGYTYPDRRKLTTLSNMKYFEIKNSLETVLLEGETYVLYYVSMCPGTSY